MPQIRPRILGAAGGVVFLLAAATAARCENTAAPEIVIGNVVAPSPDGSAATSLTVARAYFDMVNSSGGVHGRRIRLVSYDARGDLKRTLDFTRRLVEKDKATVLYQMNPAAIGNKPYVLLKNIPQIFDARPATPSGATRISGLLQGKALGRTINHVMPGAGISLLYGHDQFTEDVLTGLYAGLGVENARSRIRNRDEVRDPAQSVARLAVDRQPVLVVIGDLEMQREVVGRFDQESWRPVTFMTDAAVSLGKEELEKPRAVISVESRMAGDRASEAEQADWQRFRAKYLSAGDENPNAVFNGYLQARALVNSLEICGEDAKCLVDDYRRSPSRWIAQTISFEHGTWKAIGPPGDDISQ